MPANKRSEGLLKAISSKAIRLVFDTLTKGG